MNRLVASTLPPTRGGRLLMVAFLVDTLGTGLFIAGSMVFFTRYIGLSAGQVATGISLAALTGLLASVPLGVLADRAGIRMVQAVLHLLRALGFVLYVLCTDYVQFLLVACLIGIGDRTSPPLNQALVAMVVPAEERVRTMGLLRVVKNVSFTAGGLLAAGILAFDSATAYSALVLVNAASFVAVAWMIARLPLLTERPETRPAGHAAQMTGWMRGAWRLPALRDRHYLGLVGTNGLLCLHNTLLLVGIPLFVLERTAAPAWMVALLFVVNTVLVVVAQVRVARIVDRPGGAARAFRAAGLAMAVTCLLLVVVPGVDAVAAIMVLVLAVLALTLGEMLQSAAGWSVSFALAPEQRRGEYLTVFNLGTTVESIAGPLVIAALLYAAWPAWAGAALVFVALGLLGARLTAAPRRRTRAEPALDPV